MVIEKIVIMYDGGNVTEDFASKSDPKGKIVSLINLLRAPAGAKKKVMVFFEDSDEYLEYRRVDDWFVLTHE